MQEVKGFFLYQDKHTTQQVPYIKDYFEKLLKDQNFDTILEIGTSLAGLTYIIDDICKENNLNKNIVTFDIAYRDYVESYLKERDIDFIVCDESKPEVKQMIVDMISQGGKTLVLCDGGNKVEEFKYFSDFLKSGDFIMAHDYSVDYETFNSKIKDKIWNWFEIKYSDIQTAVEKNGLVEYDVVDFKEAVWCCYKKN
jgi:cephalosporin hydroxylase